MGGQKDQEWALDSSMVYAETVYYIVTAVFTIMVLMSMTKNTALEKAKSAYRVIHRIETSLDKIDEMQEDISELDDTVSQNNDKIDSVASEVGDVRDALKATIIFDNGQLDKDALIEDLDDNDPGVNRYYDGEGRNN